jgi:NADH dehydrogenase FAD-containing subunit
VDADRVVLATPVVATGWLEASGLACDVEGFVSVDACLRSVSHPFVFAAGDCATRVDAPRPRSGVYAVRSGPPLARNLRRVIAGATPATYQPQRVALALISLGDRRAVVSRPPWSAEGAWAWYWKDRIDRGFVARYRSAG